MSKKVGLIGVGLLGSAMAERLIATRHQVVGFDVDETRRIALQELGGTAVDSVAEVAQQAVRILLSLPDSTIARNVIEQLLPHLNDQSILIDTTTGKPTDSVELAKLVASKDARYLDATVGGSSKQARQGEVTVMVGGDADAYRECADLFHCFAPRAFYLGASGNGARMKLVVNLVLGLNRAALAEGLSFAQSQNLDLQSALEVLKSGPAWSRAMDVKGQKMLDGDFEPQARLKQHWKDVGLMLEQAEANDFSLPFTTLHEQILADLIARGFGECDNSAVIKAFEQS